jgi:hypothetical protein
MVIDMVDLLEELVEAQRKKIFQCATSIVPGITMDDILQPNDFPELEEHPYFRYEEGVFEGLLTAQTALKAHARDCEKS